MIAGLYKEMDLDHFSFVLVDGSYDVNVCRVACALTITWTTIVKWLVIRNLYANYSNV